MLTNDDIANTPIADWTTVDQTLVAIWCTNAPSTIQAVREEFLKKWNLKLLATWFWIKVCSPLNFLTKILFADNFEIISFIFFI